MVKAPHTGQIAHTGQASHGASPSIDSEYSPALDSNASAGAQGIYTQKEFQEALDQYRKKQPEAVAGALRRSLSKLPGHPGTYYLGGVMRFENGEYAKALFNFKRSTEYPDRGFNAHFYMGRIYQRQEKFAEATAAYEKYLGLTQSKEGRKQAEKYLAQMGVGKPKEHEHPAEAAQGHSKPHAAAPAHSAPAVPAAAKATVLGQDGTFFFLIPDEMSPSGKKLLEAHALCKQEKYEKAVNTLKETIQNYGGSDNAEGAVLNLASVYVRMGLHESARDRIADYLASENGASLKYRGAAHYLTGLAHLGLKDGDKAEKAFLKIKEGAPASSGGSTSPSPSQEEIDYRLSQAGELMKDSKKWSGYLEKAYASAKDKARKALLAQQLGALHAKFGSLDKAMDQYRKSMTDCTDSTLVEVCAESQLRLADLAFRKKDWKDAMTQYRQFAGKNPNHGQMPWVQYQMANIHKLMNNFESALNGYKKVIDNYPESYWAAQAKWKREDTIWQKEYKEVLD